MAYSTPYTPYEGYQEINEVLRRSGLGARVEIQEYEKGLVYALYLEEEVLGRTSDLTGLLMEIYTEFGAVFMRRYFLTSKLEKHGIESL
jgi:hypothetical protein